MKPKTSSLKPTRLPREEWDFSSAILPNDEVLACRLYESGRTNQSSSWVEAIEDWRRTCPKQSFDGYLALARQCEASKEEWPWLFYTLWPEWPLAPYLRVPADVRKRRLRLADWLTPTDIPHPITTHDFDGIIKTAGFEYYKHHLSPEMRRLYSYENFPGRCHASQNAMLGKTIQFKDDLGLPLDWIPPETQARIDAVREWLREKMPQADASTPSLEPPLAKPENAPVAFRQHLTPRKPTREIVAVEVNYTRSNEELLDAFRVWLEDRRMTLEIASPPPPEARGASPMVRQYRSDLKTLGVWRLRDAGMNSVQIVMYTQSVTGKPLVSNPSREIARATRRLNPIVHSPELWWRLHPKSIRT